MPTKAQSRRALLIALAAAGVATLAFADLRKGDYAPTQLGSLQQSASPKLEPGERFVVSSYPAPAFELAPGEGLQEVRIYCNTCHTPRYITMQPPLPPATWEAEVNKMNKAFGANIPDEETKKIIAYLQAHYTTDSRH